MVFQFPTSSSSSSLIFTLSTTSTSTPRSPACCGSGSVSHERTPNDIIINIRRSSSTVMRASLSCSYDQEQQHQQHPWWWCCCCGMFSVVVDDVLPLHRWSLPSSSSSSSLSQPNLELCQPMQWNVLLSLTPSPTILSFYLFSRPYRDLIIGLSTLMSSRPCPLPCL